MEDVKSPGLTTISHFMMVQIRHDARLGSTNVSHNQITGRGQLLESSQVKVPLRKFG
jgi:hypothetical protein